MAKFFGRTEEALKTFSANPERYAPVRISCEDIINPSTQKLGINFDARITFNSGEYFFLASFSPSSTPFAVKDNLGRLLEYKTQIDESPLLQNKVKFFSEGNSAYGFLLIVPYLSQGVRELAGKYGIGVIDLCGNVYINLNGFVVIKQDKENIYPDSQPIKKIYAGNSARVPRYLLQDHKVFRSVNEIHEGIKNRGVDLALSTVSKGLKVLEDELCIARGKNRIEVIQAEKILDGLRSGYVAPKIQMEKRYKVDPGQIVSLLNKNFKNRWMFSGTSSAQRYSSTTPPQVWTVYVKNIGDSLDFCREDRFYNLVIRQTQGDGIISFLKDGIENWACPIQCYLEMAQGDRREREIAADIRKKILEKFW